MTEIDDPVAIWAQLKALQEQVQEQNKKLAKTQLDLELSKEREQILKEQTQFDDKEAAQVEMMAQLKVLVTKVDEQEVKIEEGAKREELLREELGETKTLVGNSEKRSGSRMKSYVTLKTDSRPMSPLGTQPLTYPAEKVRCLLLHLHANVSTLAFKTVC